MSDIYAVLLEVASIQKYVFGSNKLKENYGASYLVENIFEENLRTLWESKSKDESFDIWEKDPETIRIKDPEVEAEVGYIGGGNALLFFKDENKAKELAKKWSKELLIKTPGLVPTIAIGKMDIESLDKGKGFKENITKIFDKLSENKSKYQPQTTLPRYGITAECNRTGLSAECLDDTDKDKKVYISSVAKAKLDVAKDATNLLEKEYSDILKGYYKFPLEFEDLGQSDDDSHMSIVHIDGNSMGSRFKSCTTLPQIRKLSKSVKNATKKSVRELLKTIIQKIENDDYVYDYFKYKGYDPKKGYILPIRPIIIGGDDIIFVCPGKFGVYFARIFMEKFAEEKGSDKKLLSACAGVAITKIKYPFYRGYELAEELCKNAKKESRKDEEKGSSWLDFHISYGGFSGSLEDIRNRNYTGVVGKLGLRPYRVIDGESKKTDHRNLSECIKGIKHLKGMNENYEAEEGWPNSKLKELREVLTLGASSSKIFIQEMEYRDKTLPEIMANPDCKKTGWMPADEGEVTPYFDMLELIEIYPIKLEEKGDNDVRA